MCVNSRQDNWVTRLAGIEFAINSARSDTTGFAPFYLNYGRVPTPMIHNVDSEYPGVQEYVYPIKVAIMAAHDAIIDARVKMTKQANKHRRPAQFAVGDLVYL
ncbi:hypothetical protein BDV93DRAFT_452787, partial [Ceratobasidium sp. AG-I]